MSVDILEDRLADLPRAHDHARAHQEEDFRPFTGVLVGVAAGSLVWLGLAWVLRSV